MTTVTDTSKPRAARFDVANVLQHFATVAIFVVLVIVASFWSDSF